MFEQRLRDSLPVVEERIVAALRRAGRSDAVRIVAVTKGHPLEAVHAALAAGLRDVGENRVQELESKRGEWPAAVPGPAWHLIGHLQRNKVKRAVALSDMIQSVDSLRLAEALSKEAERAGVTVRLLVQVNVSGEATKGGFDPARAVDMIAGIAALPGCHARGS
jgi:PLP dependent protein